MSNVVDILQTDADFLLRMEKCRVDDKQYEFPRPGEALRVPLKSKDQREDFILDVQRVKIQLKKITFQNRARKNIVLARVDLGGGRHRNPDGKEIECPHIHLYKEGFDDKWAYPLPSEFTNPENIFQTLMEFMHYCNVTQAPYIERGLLI